MPKAKTHRGAKKRFKKTANGVKFRRAYRNHILTKKTSKWKRQQRGQPQVDASDQPAVMRMLQGS